MHVRPGIFYLLSVIVVILFTLGYVAAQSMHPPLDNQSAIEPSAESQGAVPVIAAPPHGNAPRARSNGSAKGMLKVELPPPPQAQVSPKTGTIMGRERRVREMPARPASVPAGAVNQQAGQISPKVFSIKGRERGISTQNAVPVRRPVPENATGAVSPQVRHILHKKSATGKHEAKSLKPMKHNDSAIEAPRRDIHNQNRKLTNILEPNSEENRRPPSKHN